MDPLTVRDLMSTEPTTLAPTASVTELLDLMYRRSIRHVPIVEDGELVGLISHTDVVRSHVVEAVGEDTEEVANVANLMNTQLDVARADEPIGVAGRRILANKFGCLPVLEGRRLVGILTEADFVRYVVRVAG